MAKGAKEVKKAFSTGQPNSLPRPAVSAPLGSVQPAARTSLTQSLAPSKARQTKSLYADEGQGQQQQQLSQAQLRAQQQLLDHQASEGDREPLQSRQQSSHSSSETFKKHTSHQSLELQNTLQKSIQQAADNRIATKTYAEWQQLLDAHLDDQVQHEDAEMLQCLEDLAQPSPPACGSDNPEQLANGAAASGPRAHAVQGKADCQTQAWRWSDHP
ncbi:hypothetical protein WJX84_011934 [Apatococcus fuscideae]|uniref:Uncharacterized protein n=1 Tax=Apatococcus fuscideae TaxID=2026836 RepID=A0AAW1TFU5_9CHLO